MLGLRRTREAGDPLTGIPRIHGGQDVREHACRSSFVQCETKRHAGPEPSAVKTSIGESPAAKLRAVT